MNGLDRALVAAAVAISPPAHRATRREQWAADVRDAAELDLSSTALAFGALTTALFHRRADHRTTWGETMSATPRSVRTAPHVVGTVPVLIVFAVLSALGSVCGLALLQRYNGVPGAMAVFLADALAASVLPGAVVAGALLLVSGVGLRRRVIGAVAVLAVATVWFGITTGLVNLPVHHPLQVGLVAAALLGVWLVTCRRPRWTWSLLLLPVVAALLVAPLGDALAGSGLPYSALAVVYGLQQLVPFLVVIPGGIVAARLSTDHHSAFVEHDEALVDKSA